MTGRPAVHLDDNLSAKPFFDLLQKGLEFEQRHWHDPRAPYHASEYYQQIEESLEKIYYFIGAREEDHFIWTSSQAESISLIFSHLYKDFISQTGRNYLLIPRMENAAVYQSSAALEKLGCAVQWLDVNENGQVTAREVEKAINPKTALVSISWANPLLGTIHPIWEIADLCKERGLFLHVDATSILGKTYFRFSDLPIDFLTFDGGRLHGPFGSGGIFIKNAAPLQASLKEDGLRRGNWSAGKIISLGLALERLGQMQEHLCLEVPRLRNCLENAIQEEVKESVILYPEAERLLNTSVIAFPQVYQEALLFLLREQNIFASIGGGLEQTLAHLLKPYDSFLAKCALSFSLPPEITQEEITYAAKKIGEGVRKMQKISKGVFSIG